MHVDEQKFRASSHGQLTCRDCHMGVDIIPHVGKNKTDCDSVYHQSKQDRRLLTNTSRKEFHSRQRSVTISLKDRTSCKIYHQIYPHSKKPFVRAFLNMHTGYLACQVCHLKRSKFDIVSYSWVNTNEVVFDGKPFGAVYDPLRKLTHKPQSSLPRTVPFVMRKGRSQALMNAQDTAGALKVAQHELRRIKVKKHLKLVTITVTW